MQQNPSTLSGIIYQLALHPVLHPVEIRKVDSNTCAYKGCTNTRHIAKSGNIWKKCSSCAHKENQRSQAKKIRERKTDAKPRVSLRSTHRF